MFSTPLAALPILVLAGCQVTNPISPAPQTPSGLLPARVSKPELTGRAPGRYVESFTFGNLKRSYILFVPEKRKAAAPLVVALHGVTSNANSMAALTEIKQHSDEEGFIAVVPNGSGGLSGWNVGWLDLSGSGADDVGFVKTIMDRTEKEFAIDLDREYVLGHSNGAFLANVVAARLSDRIAAFASVAGSIGLNNAGKSITIDSPQQPVSALFIHGRKDNIVSYDGTIAGLITNISAPKSALWWAEKDGCSLDPQSIDFAEGKANRMIFSKGKRGTEVELITTKAGLHDFPGAPLRSGRESLHGIDGMKEILEFFRTHPKLPR